MDYTSNTELNINLRQSIYAIWGKLSLSNPPTIISLVHTGLY